MFKRKPSSQSPSLLMLGYGFAFLAAGTSSMGAWIAVSSMGLDPIATKCAAGVLIFVSVMLVLYERSAIGAIRSRRLRGDHKAARQGRAFLILACAYTAIMQATFFGGVFMAAQAKDTQAESSIADIDKRITELESETRWKLAVFADPDALRQEIAGLEKQAEAKGKDMAESRKAAAAALPLKRADLSSVLYKQKVDRELIDLREKRTVQLGQPTNDPKKAVLGLVLGLIGIAAGDKLTYGLIVLGVTVVQMGQILLPAIAGKSEAVAVRAAAARIDVDEATIELKAEPAKVLLEAPKSVPMPMPATAPLGELARKAQAIREQREREAQEAAARAAKPKKAPSKPAPKAPPAPARTGLASKIR